MQQAPFLLFKVVQWLWLQEIKTLTKNRIFWVNSNNSLLNIPISRDLVITKCCNRILETTSSAQDCHASLMKWRLGTTTLCRAFYTIFKMENSISRKTVSSVHKPFKVHKEWRHLTMISIFLASFSPQTTTKVIAICQITITFQRLKGPFLDKAPPKSTLNIMNLD
jgi:hypothetical protein